MRVVVCPDRIGALASADAGVALARAFRAARPATEVAVVPLARGGADLADALARLGAPAVVVEAASPEEPPHGMVPEELPRGTSRASRRVVPEEPPRGTSRASRRVVPEEPPRGTSRASRRAHPHSSVALGHRLADALRGRPERVVVDLTGIETADAGAGVLAALGATADAPLDAGPDSLAGLTTIDLAAARRLVADTELVAVVDAAGLADVLLGLRGLTARRAFASGAAPASMLARDAAIGALAGALGVPDAPGLGAGGGVPLALTALGGWVTTGPALCASVANLSTTAARADVLVTGCDTLGFADRGGDVVAEAAAMAERVMRPCVAVARTVSVSARELRTFGIEAAYALGEDAAGSADALTAGAAGVARSWSW